MSRISRLSRLSHGYHGYHADITDFTDSTPGLQERAPPRHRLIPQDYLRDAPGIHFPCPKVRVFTVLRCDRVLQPKTSKINKTLAGVGRNPHRSASVIPQKRSRIHGVAFRNSFCDTQGFNERPKMSRARLGGAPGTFPDDLGAPRALPVLSREVAGAVLDILGGHWQCSRPSSPGFCSAQRRLDWRWRLIVRLRCRSRLRASNPFSTGAVSMLAGMLVTAAAALDPAQIRFRSRASFFRTASPA